MCVCVSVTLSVNSINCFTTIQNSRWRTAAILKIDISPYLSEKSSDFDEVLYTAVDFELNERHMIKNENFQNSICWTAAILKIVISPYLSETMKFCTQQQILKWMNITWSKMKKLHWTDSEFDRTYFFCIEIVINGQWEQLTYILSVVLFCCLSCQWKMHGCYPECSTWFFVDLV